MSTTPIPSADGPPLTAAVEPLAGGAGMSLRARALKRGFDLVGATVGLVLLLPLLIVLAVLIAADSAGPVLYRQTRVGRRGEHFQMFKFRSMVDGADALKPGLSTLNEASLGLFKIAADPRITRVGAWMRRSHLDELPQLWNVLRGEMSLVGPRPLIEEEDSLLLGQDRARLNLAPGITGPWQIRGPMTTSLSEMAQLDQSYLAHWSLRTDVLILLKTARRVVGRNGH